MKNNLIVVDSPNNNRRIGWAEAFEEMAVNDDDELLLPEFFDDKEIAE